jgi:hypothetical protein
MGRLRGEIAVAVLACGVLLSGCGVFDGSGGLSPEPPPAGFDTLPAPASLASAITAWNACYQVDGDSYIPIAGENLVAKNGAALDFTPDYPTPGVSAPGGISYAVYAIDLADADAVPQLKLAWQEPPAPGMCWIGLANREAAVWDWHRVDSPAEVDLGLADWQDYLLPGTPLELLLAVAVLGDSPVSLDHLQVGPAPVPRPDEIYVLPNKTTVKPGEVVRLTVYVNETAAPIWFIPGIRVLVQEGNTYVNSSIDAGTPGDPPDGLDGIWAEQTGSAGDPAAAFWNTNCEVAGCDALEINLTPAGPSSPAAGTGAVCNFQLQVNVSSAITFQRFSVINRTYYQDQDASSHNWSNYSNAGFPGLTVLSD